MANTIPVTVRYDKNELDHLQQFASEGGFTSVAQYIRSLSGFEVRSPGIPEGLEPPAKGKTWKVKRRKKRIMPNGYKRKGK